MQLSHDEYEMLQDGLVALMETIQAERNELREVVKTTSIRNAIEAQVAADLAVIEALGSKLTAMSAAPTDDLPPATTAERQRGLRAY